MESFTPKLKTAIWVQAQLRLCDQKCIPLMVLHKGDPDAGAVLLKIIGGRDACRVFSRAYTLDGEQGWLCCSGADAVDEAAADAYIERQLKYDRDLWVLEIEDAGGFYQLDAPIID